MLNEEKLTIDVFHRGGFSLVQAKDGHRSGMDAMMLAGAVPQDFSGHLADLGSGSGAAGLAVAARCKKARISLVERSPLMLDCAYQTLSLAQNAALAPRVDVVKADVTLSGQARLDAGLINNHYDFVIMNPPFNHAHDRMTPDEAKASAHVMAADMFEKWLRTSKAILKAQGHLALIARPSSIDDILKAAAGRFGGLSILPIHARAHEAAIRLVICGQSGSRAPLQFLPPLIIHDAQGHGFSARADAINNGRSSLWDKVEEQKL